MRSLHTPLTPVTFGTPEWYALRERVAGPSSTESILRRCRGCGDVFISIRPTHRVCSTKCQQRVYRAERKDAA